MLHIKFIDHCSGIWKFIKHDLCTDVSSQNTWTGCLLNKRSKLHRSLVGNLSLAQIIIFTLIGLAIRVNLILCLLKYFQLFFQLKMPGLLVIGIKIFRTFNLWICCQVCHPGKQTANQWNYLIFNNFSFPR